uniref:Eukaryotic translation initiation factor 3 subunit J n=1 Tax=Anthurium amnicola TaxID=1678845 RepID=A0A1D1Y6B8_9ARAE
MSDWEDRNFDIPARHAVKQSKWADEDVEKEDVKENWDEASDEESTITLTTPSKNTSVAQRAIAKKEKMNNNDSDEDELDEIERKKRERKAIMDADMENTKGLFGIEDTDNVNSKDSNNAVSPPRNVATKGGSSLDKISPKSKEEFDEFSRLLVERIRKYEKQPSYGNFINGFVRELCVSLKDADLRRISTTLTNLSNERQKSKDKPKKKGKSKPSLQVENDTDLTNYDDYDTYDRYDDYDDFI